MVNVVSDPPSVVDVLSDRLSEVGRVLLRQVNLVLGIVESEGDGFGGFGAIEVVDQVDECLCGHCECPSPSASELPRVALETQGMLKGRASATL